jgi:hypothetical protein
MRKTYADERVSAQEERRGPVIGFGRCAEGLKISTHDILYNFFGHCLLP